MMHGYHRTAWAGIVLAAGGVAAANAVAAAGPDESSTGQLEEVVVTAQKRSENVQTVPATISVFTAADLKNAGVSSTDQLSMMTPGLVFNTVNGYAQPFIRGIGSDQVTSTAESAVGYYVDGVYFASVSAMLQELNDVERIEVLKGPQGTLYGRNTTGGAINVVTRDPDPDGAASLSASGGNLDSRQVKGYASWGSHTLAMSVAAVSTYHDGYMRNLLDGQGFNNENSWGARGKIKYTPNDIVSVTFSVDYSTRRDRGGSGYVPLDKHPLAELLGGLYGTSPEETYVNFPDARYSLVDKGYSVNTRAHLGPLDLVSITAYRQTDRFSGVDLDASTLSLENVAGPQPGWNWSQEFQLISTSSGPLQWIAGAYAFGSREGFDPLSIYLPGNVPSYIQVWGNQNTKAYALFGQASYALTNAWTLTAGIRANRDQKALAKDYQFIPAFALEVPGPDASKTWNNTSPMATLEYHEEGLLLYGKFSKGFKSGTYNVLANTAAPVDPEKITAYEVGGKHDLLERTLRLDWAGFYYDYKNLQVSTVQNGEPNLQNAAGSETYGIDLDVMTALGPNFKTTLGAEWLHSKYTNFKDAVVYVPNPATGGYGNVPIDRDVSGNDTIRSPKLTFSAQFQYTVPVPIGALDLIANYYFNDGLAFDPGNLYTQGAYSLVNLRANLAMLDKRLVLSAYGKNLLNREILTGVAPSNFAILGQYDAPRTWGVEVSYDF